MPQQVHSLVSKTRPQIIKVLNLIGKCAGLPRFERDGSPVPALVVKNHGTGPGYLIPDKRAVKVIVIESRAAVNYDQGRSSSTSRIGRSPNFDIDRRPAGF